LIAGTIASLPVRITSKNADGSTSPVTDHPAYELLHYDAHALYSANVFFEAALSWGLLNGNGYAVIERRPNGQPTGLRLIDGSCTPRLRNGRIAYSVVEESVARGYDQDDILHFRGTTNLSGVTSLSPVVIHGQSMRIGLSAEEYAARFYDQGVNPPGYITYEGKVTEDMADEIRKYWAEKFGGVKNSHRPAVLSEGGVFKELMTDPETAQLMMARSFQVIDVARAFGVPPHMIGETDKTSSWGTGVEAQTTSFYVTTLRRHIRRAESELRRKLLGTDRELSVNFDIDAFLRADLKARDEHMKLLLGGTQNPGIESRNEIRARLDLPRIDDPAFDKPYEPPAKAAAKPNNGETDV
jgi:HK97 family phage portal protein